MKRLWNALPGPAAGKAALMLVLIAAVLVVLFFVFEWAGDLLDSGGVIGA